MGVPAMLRWGASRQTLSLSCFVKKKFFFFFFFFFFFLQVASAGRLEAAQRNGEMGVSSKAKESDEEEDLLEL